MACRQLFFKFFLILYGGFLLVHVWEMGFDSRLLAVGLLGAAAVFVAHKSHGRMPMAFLVAHMVLEWYYHALHGNHYGSSEILFHGVHAALDAVFLYVEAREHYPKYAAPLIGLVLAVLVTIFVVSFVPARPVFAAPLTFPGVSGTSEVFQGGHKHERGTLHFLFIGGVLGCLAAHMASSLSRNRSPHGQ